ncbi:MATH domain and coiled-coil domain-containing protein At3g58370-like [Trifolium pratense]|uniref:MATH domain and coiled-coil domain-containing protein At3g58370-like n=1 Tax=Trifolium pratense TaxID=57577 RepID=UPI001E69357D|nr:MATH domain and coiled-coil domain-containing protein At3g58370-like [Trifolium pratense]
MESEEVSNTEIFEKFTWKIENFSRWNVDEIYSEPFILGGYPWRIQLLPKGYAYKKEEVDEDENDYLSIYLEAVKTTNMAEGWSRYVKYKLVIFNQLNSNRTISEEGKQDFNAAEGGVWGFPSFMTLTELHDPEMGFIVKDACIIGAEVFVFKSTLEKPMNRAASFTISVASGNQNGDVEVEVPMPNPEVQDPKLETISPVSTHIDAESRKFNDLVFAALGRVLYFLKTRKVKDMNDQACKELQIFWDELKKFKIDLTWLEPQVQSALGMKSFVEKALQVENLKENIVVIELEADRLKAKLAAAEVSLDVERDLLKAKDIKERDLDSELGSGS